MIIYNELFVFFIGFVHSPHHRYHLDEVRHLETAADDGPRRLHHEHLGSTSDPIEFLIAGLDLGVPQMDKPDIGIAQLEILSEGIPGPPVGAYVDGVEVDGEIYVLHHLRQHLRLQAALGTGCIIEEKNAHTAFRRNLLPAWLEKSNPRSFHPKQRTAVEVDEQLVVHHLEVAPGLDSA